MQPADPVASPRFAAAGGGSSRGVARAMVLTELPSLDTGCVTDRNSLDRRTVRMWRAAEVARLHDNNDLEVTRP